MEVLPADGIHLRLTFILVALCEVELFAQLADDIDVCFGDDSCQGGKYYLFTDAIDGASVDNRRHFRRISYALGQKTNHIFVALAVGRGHIVADADIATLEGGIQFAEFTNTLGVQVRNAAVILAELLDDVFRDIAATD